MNDTNEDLDDVPPEGFADPVPLGPAATRLRLLRAGYTPLPNFGKKPPLEEWQKLENVTAEQLELWDKIWPGAINTGVLTRNVPAFDVDILNDEAACAVEAMVRERYEETGRLLTRFGKLPKRAFLFRSHEPFAKITINFVVREGAAAEKLELLCDGQQVIVDGIHPDTHKPYAWFGGELGLVRREDLPAITKGEAAALMERAAEILVKDFGYVRAAARPQRERSNGKAHDGGGPADWKFLADNIHAGRDLHDSLRDLAAKLVTSGMGAGAAVNLLYALMEGSQVKASGDHLRWQARRDDIPRLVDTAGQFSAAAAATTTIPIEPTDLWAKFDPPTLPRGLLPPAIEAFAFDRSAVMGCDPAGLAVGALVVCAASIPEDIKLQPKRNDTRWLESARIWAGLIGGVSEMKSPMLGTVVEPVHTIDNEMSRDYHEALGQWLALPKKKRDKTPRPKQLRAKIMNTTVESAQEILRDSPNGVLLEQDELSGWFGSMDKYSGARGAQADRAFWLQTYNGTSYSVDRIGRGSLYIPHLSVSILGFIQPEPIRKLADGGEDDGLLQRFITIILRPAVIGGDEAPGQSVFNYIDLINNLRDLKPPKTGHLLPATANLTFDDGALKIRSELEKKHLELSQCKTLNRKLTSHVGKYNGIFARLCVIWHCVEHVNDKALPAVVTEDTARRVADFLHGYLFRHAMAFYANVLGLSNDHDRLSNIADYILAHKLERITVRDVARGDRSMRNLKKHETDAVFEQLEALGWLIRMPGPRPADPVRWTVNPAVHQRFTQRADAERNRREQDRRLVEEALKNRAKA